MPTTRPQPLTESEIEKRKRWLSFSEQDEKQLLELDPLMSEKIDGMMERMYEHFVKFEETRGFFTSDQVLERAKSAQTEYFKRITKGNYDSAYTAQRLIVGDTHHRIGLDPKWYLGAYSRVLLEFIGFMQERFADNPEFFLESVRALIRIIFFDMGMALDSYIEAKERAIRAQRAAIAGLEAEKRAINSVLEDSPIGLARFNKDMQLVSCNRQFQEIIGAEPDDSVFTEIFVQRAPERLRDAFKFILESGEPLQSNAELLRMAQDRPPEYWDWAAWPVKEEGVPSGFMAMFAKVTDRVLLQQQREDFVATLTHDLKTPILAANRAVKLLIEGDFGQVTESQARILETLHQSNQSMYKMVQTLLDVYRYDSGAKELNKAPHDLCQMLMQMVEELKTLADAKKIKLELELPDAPREVLCDLDELRRVVQNFLDNSLKFTHRGGTIRILMVQDREKTQVKVTDTGKGISAEDKPKLFQRFWQAASSGRYYASTGLGLYLCRQIVEYHGGKIWCESEEGKGSTFAFTITD